MAASSNLNTSIHSTWPDFDLSHEAFNDLLLLVFEAQPFGFQLHDHYEDASGSDVRFIYVNDVIQTSEPRDLQFPCKQRSYQKTGVKIGIWTNLEQPSALNKQLTR